MQRESYPIKEMISCWYFFAFFVHSKRDNNNSYVKEEFINLSTVFFRPDFP